MGGGVARVVLNRFEPWFHPVIATVFDPFRADVVIVIGEKKPALEGVLERMKQSPEGREILLERPGARSTRVNLRDTWGLPHNSFGAAYARFAQCRNSSPDDRAPVLLATKMDELEYLEMRVREVRDFWHVLFGIPADVVGKSALKVIECLHLPMGFRMNWFVGGTARLSWEQRNSFFLHYFPYAVVAGDKCTDLMCLYYEKHLQEDLDDVRIKWGIFPVPAPALKLNGKT